ncbi:hypothetical protein Misp02_46880 [Microtetraspora sp. NBRC 16547]|nr:hypothetical protein Misp02_46880 [Microtetraspora sp. NBRC 16547]
MGLWTETETFLLHLPFPVRTTGPWPSASVVTQATGRIAVTFAIAFAVTFAVTFAIAFALSCGHATAPDIATAVTTVVSRKALRSDITRERPAG